MDAQAVDGGDGTASVSLEANEESAVRIMAARTMSDSAVDPLTGAELGMGEQGLADDESREQLDK